MKWGVIVKNGTDRTAWRIGAVFGLILAVWAEPLRAEGGPGKEIHQDNRERMMQLTGSPDISARQQAFERRAAAAPSAPKWESTGPYGVGRVPVVTVDPGDDKIVYVGAASGGVWKTTDGGASFKQIFNDAKSQSSGDLAIAPSDRNLLWMGTGENNGGGGSITYPGAGIYKSTNAGQTWQHMGLDSSHTISRIAIHPTNPNIVLVAVVGSFWEKSQARGVYRTTNAGATWEKVLYMDDSTGASDVVIHPTNPNRVFANFWTAHRYPFARTWGGNSCRMHRSDDGGATWKLLGSAEGLPTNDLGRSSMDVCKSNPNIMYLIYLASNNTFKAIYKSTNAGDNWAPISASPPGATMFSYYAHSFCRIRINPTDPNDIVVLGITSYRSTSGGASWSRCFLNTHADARAFSWSTQNNNLVYLGDDGGFSSSTGGPNGTFNYKGRQAAGGLEMAQIYNMDIASDNANYRYVGLQDNGVQMTTNGGGSWQEIVGGDGMCIRVDYGAPANVIGCLQDGNFQRSSSRGTGMVAISGFTGRGPWDSPVDIDPTNGMAYIGSEFILRATRGSGNFAKVSPDLSNGDHSVANYGYGTVQAIAAHNGVVYAGTDDGNVWVTKDGRAASPTWTRTRNGKTGGPGTGERSFDGWIKEITVDASIADASNAYVAISYFRWGPKNWKPSAYKLTNFGLGGPGTADWKDVSGDLPPYVSVNKVIKDSAPARNGWLYAATEFGMFYSTNGGVNWAWLGDKALPIITVNDMNLHAGTNYLYAGSYGRGLWRINLAEVTVHSETIAAQGAQFLKNFPNPVSLATQVQFRVRNDQKLLVAVYDMSGRHVRTLFDQLVQAGKPYAINWDRTDGVGAKVPAGHYILRAMGDKVTLARRMEVVTGSM
jgi:hypothetical protein